MEGVIRPVPALESPDLALINCSQNELTRSYSDASSLTQEIFKDEFHQNVNLPLDDCTAWTDEKHNSYLDHLEASFVMELHRSMGLAARCSEHNVIDARSSQEQPANNNNVSQQYTVVSMGYCPKMTSDRTQPPMDTAAVSSIDIKSPCIHNYRSICNCCALFSINHGEYSTFRGENTQSRGKRTYSPRLAPSFGKKLASKQCDEHLAGNVAEVSDQNFVDEDQEEKINSSSIRKRMKTALANTSSQDQIVPCGKIFVMGVSPGTSTSLEREEQMLSV